MVISIYLQYIQEFHWLAHSYEQKNVFLCIVQGLCKNTYNNKDRCNHALSINYVLIYYMILLQQIWQSNTESLLLCFGSMSSWAVADLNSANICKFYVQNINEDYTAEDLSRSLIYIYICMHIYSMMTNGNRPPHRNVHNIVVNL